MKPHFLLISLMLIITFTTSGCVNKHKQQRAELLAEAKAQERHNKHLIESVRETGAPILIFDIASQKPNSAGGVEVDVEFANTSDRTFKYIEFTVTPYNRVGDVVSSQTNGRRTAIVTGVGPMKPTVRYTSLQNHFFNFENVWYNHTINCIKVSKVKIIYLNGSEEVISGQLLSAINLNNKGDCAL